MRRECQIHVSIEEEGEVIASGSLGKGLDWTRLECAFICRAMSTVMEGTTDALVVEMGIARLIGIERKTDKAAAKEIGVSKKTFTRMMDRETKHRTRRKKDD